jgi:hypothetical protein
MGAESHFMRKGNHKEVVINLPNEIKGVSKWLIFSADLSLTRTGFAISVATPIEGSGVSHRWISIGSIKPGTSAEPVWVRSKAIATFLKGEVQRVAPAVGLGSLGLIIVLEQAPPMNDFLSSINRVLHAVLLDTDLHKLFEEVHILSINASSLRSVMGLTKTGAKNKLENIAKSLEYIDKTSFCEVDSDSCDAILLSTSAWYASALLLGRPDAVPDKFKRLFCNATQVIKGKGRNAKTVTAGILWRPEYWTTYKPHVVALKLKDASVKTKKLQIREFVM